MLGVLMLLSFLVPLVGALAIRRYWWTGAWAAVSAVVAAPVLNKLITHTYDPMGWGFLLVLVFLPAAIGSALGIAVTALRRRLSGPGAIAPLNIGIAAGFAAMTVFLGLVFSTDV